ncbi:MAG: hypothetical protein ACYDA9_02665 [Terriglobia bacterium]
MLRTGTSYFALTHHHGCQVTAGFVPRSIIPGEAILALDEFGSPAGFDYNSGAISAAPQLASRMVRDASKENVGRRAEIQRTVKCA